MGCDILLLSPWTDAVHVSPSYQLVREEITRAASRLAQERLSDFFERNGDRAQEYADVVRYQKHYPFCPGLLSIAAVLEERGYRVRCVSLDLEREADGGEGWLDRVMARLCAETELAVGVTAVTPEIERALAVLRSAKRAAPHLKTMIGGTHVTYVDEAAALDPAVDAVVRGEGEMTTVELADCWAAGRGIEEVAGISYGRGNEVVRTGARALLDMRSLPMPAYHLIDGPARNRLHVTPTFTRGCPFTCSYCVESIFWNRRLRHKDPVRFVDELEYIAEELNWRFIHIADSTFGLNKRETAALCDELERRKLDAVFSVNVRPDVFDYLGEDLVRRLVDLNFVEFYMGMESIDEQLLASLDRRQSYEALLGALHRFKALGVPFVKLYLIVGLPGDGHASLQATINTVRELLEDDLIYYATAKYFTPTPGTEQFAEPAAHGYELLTEDWPEFERYTFPPVTEHAQLSPYEIEHYIGLLQAMQLGVLRRRLGRDADERQRLQAWAADHYLERVYL